MVPWVGAGVSMTIFEGWFDTLKGNSQYGSITNMSCKWYVITTIYFDDQYVLYDDLRQLVRHPRG